MAVHLGAFSQQGDWSRECRRPGRGTTPKHQRREKSYWRKKQQILRDIRQGDGPGHERNPSHPRPVTMADPITPGVIGHKTSQKGCDQAGTRPALHYSWFVIRASISPAGYAL